MKKLLFIILSIFFTLTSNYAQPQVFNHTNENEGLYEHVLSLIVNDLNLENANISILVCDTKFDKQNSNEYAIVRKVNDEMYVINIKSFIFNIRTNKIKIFIHEMVHISQLYHNRLVIRDKYVWFEGTLYFGDSDYVDRTYEREAFRLENELFQKYRDLF